MPTDVISSNTLIGLATAGPTTFGGINYNATSLTLPELLPIGTQGVNHGRIPTLLPCKTLTSRASGIGLDGDVALLTITIVK